MSQKKPKQLIFMIHTKSDFKESVVKNDNQKAMFLQWMEL